MSKRKPNLVKVSIDLIGTMADIQTREAISEQTVEDYKHAIENNEPLPPIDVAYIGPGGGPVVISGHHRLMAHKAAGHDTVTCDAHYEIRNVATALEFATKANREHGLRPSLKDRQRTLRLWMQHKRLFDKSDRSIAKAVGVDHKTVGKLREELVTRGEIPTSQRRKGADGKTYPSPKPKAEKPAPATTVQHSDEAITTAAEKLSVSPTIVAKAQRVLGSGKPDVIHAVDAGQMTLDEALDNIAEPADVDHREDQDGDDEAGVADPDIRRKENAVSIRLRVRGWLKDIASEDQLDAIAAARKALDEIEERLAQECAA